MIFLDEVTADKRNKQREHKYILSYCSCDKNLRNDISFLVEFMYFAKQGV